ncbi:MAG: OmpA family protein [Sedimentisphaerales bacterium]|nr:OmpA family protein [Sedimentisphaerales bacterium]
MKRAFLGVAMLLVFSTLAGCTNWEKRYKDLDVEHQNLRGLYENCVASLEGAAADKTRLSQELANLKGQMAQGKSPGEASGFGPGMDVKWDEAAGTLTVTLPNEILFSSGQATLRQATVTELDHVLSVLRERYAGREIDVVGHTDTDPIKKTAKLWKDNWELSTERALTVVRYMVERGISAAQIRAVGCGQSRPVASNSTSSGKAKNRRVEIVVHMR